MLRVRAAERPITVREVLMILGGRGYSLLLIMLALPFATPVPLPGVSTPFGLAIALIALRLLLGQRPWLPKRIQRRTLPADFFDKVLKLSGAVIRFFEKFLRPRLPGLTAYGWLRQVHALPLLLAAIVLMLPLPIPFSNTIPALVIVLMAGGLLERDGIFILAAHVLFAAGIAYFLFLGVAMQQFIEAFREWLAR